jgi:DNA-binding transcriptional regulator LsrR (DeoR family)
MPKSAPSEEEYRLCVQVAKLYYEGDLTQDEIGERLGYSRVKINRVLRQAREIGIVEVKILTPPDSVHALENALMVRYGLRDVLVVESEGELYLALARGAAYWLRARLSPGMRIGLGLGRTISYLPQVFKINRAVDCTFTEIVGAASDHSGGLNSYNVISRMAELAGGKAEFFYAPTFVSDAELKQKLLGEPSVIQALERARSCDVIMQSVGVVDESAILYLHHYITVDDLHNLRKMGAVGDAVGHYFDCQGRPVPSFTDERVIGLDLADMRNIPWSLMVAGGASKVEAVTGALRGKYFNALVTDRLTAVALLEEDHAV